MRGYLFFGYWRKDECSGKPMSLVAVVTSTGNATEIINEFNKFGQIKGDAGGGVKNLNYIIAGLLTKERYVPFSEIKQIADRFNIKAINAAKYIQNIPTLSRFDYEDAFLEILLQHIMDKK